MEICIDVTGKITTKWYKKAISSGRILNFLSSHPRSQLINTAEGFIFRVLSLTSVEHMDEIKEIMWGLLKKNNYPTRLINVLLCRVHQKLHNVGNNAVVLTCDPQPKRFFSIHYVAGLSERIARNLETEMMDIKIAFRAPRTMDAVYNKMNDKVCMWDLCNVIYAIKCLICPKRFYVGKTEQRLRSRKKQHLYIASKMIALQQQEKELNQDADASVVIINDSIDESCIKGKILELCNASAIAQHMYECNHTFDFENTIILNHENNSRKLSTLEMLYINKLPNVNKVLDLDKLSSSYKGILKSLQDKKL
jgi:hypothetical protein